MVIVDNPIAKGRIVGEAMVVNARVGEIMTPILAHKAPYANLREKG